MKLEKEIRKEFNRICDCIKPAHKCNECECCISQKAYADALLWVLWDGFQGLHKYKKLKKYTEMRR